MTVQAAADEPTEPASPSRRKQVVWLGLGAVAYFALGLLGRATIADGEVLSLVWPAAGAAMLLFGLAPLRLWWPTAGLVAVATVALNLLTGATPTQSAIFVVSNIAQAICAVLLLRSLAPRLRGAGGDEPLEELRDFYPVLTASVIGSLVGAAVGGVGRGLFLDTWSLTDVVIWWGRNATGCVVVVTTVLLVVAVLPGIRGHRGRAVLEDLRTRGPEAAVLAAFTAVIYLGVFGIYDSLPLAFPLLVPTVWAGLRFSALFVGLHSIVVSTIVVSFTLADRGVFASVDTWNEKVLVSQLYVGLVFCLGILLALGRGERLSLSASLTSTQAVSESQAEVLSAIIDTMHDGLSVIDETGQVLRRNPAGAEMLRTDADRLDNISESQFTITNSDGSRLPAADYPWMRAIEGENVVNQDIVLAFDDGSPSRTLAVSARRLPTLDDRGLRQAVVIYHDVTTDRAQRTALESFARVVAHDLRGPLGVIDGWTELLSLDLEVQEAVVPREAAAAKLGRIETAAQTMHRLIDDLLDSSISREQQLRTSIVDLEDLACSVADQWATAGPSGVTPPRIEVATLPDVHADAALVRQLLDNLVANAVKYVVPGSVPRVEITGREVGDRVEVTVADEGIGIPASERDRIFEAFHRGESAHEYDGHGIGLAVCKTIVERHGGRIAARPPVGSSGTRIVFTLPAVRDFD